MSKICIPNYKKNSENIKIPKYYLKLKLYYEDARI